MTPECKLAAGNDNLGSLQTLYELGQSSGLFVRYRFRDPLTEWRDQEARARDGTRAFIPIGAAWCVWVFQALTMAEYNLLKTTYCYGVLSAPVTLRTYNKTLNAYLNYNGQMNWPGEDERSWVSGDWANVRIVFDNLRLYSGYSSGYDPLAYGV